MPRRASACHATSPIASTVARTEPITATRRLREEPPEGPPGFPGTGVGSMPGSEVPGGGVFAPAPLPAASDTNAVGV